MNKGNIIMQKELTAEKLLARVSGGRRPALKPHDLQKINQIDLDGEQLSEIPAAVISLIPATTRLFLQNNSLSNISMLQSLVHLRYLNLANKQYHQGRNWVSNLITNVGLP